MLPISLLFITFSLLLAGLGTEPKTLHMVGKHSTTELHPAPLFTHLRHTGVPHMPCLDALYQT